MRTVTMRTMVKTVVTGVAALSAAVAIGACGNTATKETASSPAAPAQTSTTAAVSAHNQADVHFAHMMIPHHQQAVEMSDMILAKQGLDPRVVELATQIKAAQGPEIAQMQGWLTQWGAPGMADMPGMNHGGMGNMPGMDHGGMGSMPGMAGMMSPADMDALKNAQGVEASTLFLTQMIEHHKGAITMAQDEIKNGQFADAIAMAKSIVETQQREIDTMNQILSSL